MCLGCELREGCTASDGDTPQVVCVTVQGAIARREIHPVEHVAKGDALAEAFNNAAKALSDVIHATVPEGRARSLALTKLDECALWACEGIRKGVAK
jgi:hypothetical protein